MGQGKDTGERVEQAKKIKNQRREEDQHNFKKRVRPKDIEQGWNSGTWGLYRQEEERETGKLEERHPLHSEHTQKPAQGGKPGWRHRNCSRTGVVVKTNAQRRRTEEQDAGGLESNRTADLGREDREDIGRKVARARGLGRGKSRDKGRGKGLQRGLDWCKGTGGSKESGWGSRLEKGVFAEGLKEERAWRTGRGRTRGPGRGRIWRTGHGVGKRNWGKGRWYQAGKMQEERRN